MPKGTSIAGVGIDGPLARNLKIVDRYRSADALLSRGHFQRRGKPGQTNSPTGRDLHAHATKLAMLVISLWNEGYLDIQAAEHPDPIYEARILEVFPTAFLAVLLSDDDHTALRDQFTQEKIPREKKSDAFWKKAVREGYLKHLVETLAPQKSLETPLESTKNHDHRAAFICALAALCVAKNQYVAVGDPEDGHIMLPPFQLWQPWARDALHRNIETMGKNSSDHKNAQVLSNGIPWD